MIWNYSATKMFSSLCRGFTRAPILHRACLSASYVFLFTLFLIPDMSLRQNVIAYSL